MSLLEIVTPLHKCTTRDYHARADKDKPRRMDIAMQFGDDYWHDPEGRYGYKDHKYIPGRWKPVAEKLLKQYYLPRTTGRVPDPCRILDVGCGMGFLLAELNQMLPGSELTGFDISREGLACSLHQPGMNVFRHDASKPFPFMDNYFDLVISLGCLHNLLNYEREVAIKEIERVGRRKFIMVESYRNNQELCNLQWWAYTCVAFMRPDEWVYEYRRLGYTGDWEFIYFE